MQSCDQATSVQDTLCGAGRALFGSGVCKEQTNSSAAHQGKERNQTQREMLNNETQPLLVWSCVSPQYSMEMDFWERIACPIVYEARNLLKALYKLVMKRQSP